jgi:hypothetical protein
MGRAKTYRPRDTLISVKTSPPSPETGHNGFGAVDALREEIEGAPYSPVYA